jgi:hypothetical protein
MEDVHSFRKRQPTSRQSNAHARDIRQRHTTYCRTGLRGMKSYARPPRAQLFAGRVLTCLIIFDLPKSWCAVQSASSQSELIHFSFSYLFSFLIFLIMPKSNSLLSLWIKDYPELYLDKGSVFCKYCSKIVSKFCSHFIILLSIYYLF